MSVCRALAPWGLVLASTIACAVLAREGHENAAVIAYAAAWVVALVWMLVDGIRDGRTDRP